MKKLRETRGITLVALVIIIIILLILAGISIQAIKNTGIFAQAENAKNLTEEKTAEENEILTNYLEQMNKIIGGQVTESIPDGASATPINDITTWLKTAGISKQYSYTTIEEVIADSTCTQSLMNNENAMKYLERSTGFSDAICANETAMTYLGQSPYVDDTVLNSDIWTIDICNSTYFESVLCDKVPAMTSATTPSGEVSASSAAYDKQAYQLFAIGDLYHQWTSFRQTASESWIQYKFNNPILIKKVVLNYWVQNNSFTAKIQASNDGVNWDDVSDIFASRTDCQGTGDNQYGPSGLGNISVKLNTSNYYLYYRFQFVSSYYSYVYSGYRICNIDALQFYGRLQKQ